MKKKIISVFSLAMVALLMWGIVGCSQDGKSLRTLTFRYPGDFFAPVAPRHYAVYYKTASAPSFSEDRVVYIAATNSTLVTVKLPADITEIRLDLAYENRTAGRSLKGLSADSTLDGISLEPNPADAYWLVDGLNLTTYYPNLPRK